MKFSLSGKWKLSYRDNLGCDRGEISATVPGNVELDLIEAGLLPEDIHRGFNIRLAEKYETYDWTYSTEFDCENPERGYSLLFEGVDCVAEYFLNGEKIGESDNMLVEHEFDVNNLKHKGNILEVVIHSTFLHNSNMEYDAWTLSGNGCLNCETPYLRRAAHTYMWDIMPRAISAGIWKNVWLIEKEDYAFEQLFLNTRSLETEMDGTTSAVLQWFYCIKSPDPIRAGAGYRIKIEGHCGDSDFLYENEVFFKAETDDFTFRVKRVKLWWPYGYGEPNLYDVTFTLLKNGKEVAVRKLKFGIRTVKMIRTDNDFGFVVNGVDVYIRGTNWVPLSPYHSEDSKRLPRAVCELKKLNLNMVRCWGGNVYESDEFFDEMDRAGIMVWQDFAFACTFYPQDDLFLKKVEAEAEKVIKRLRQHPSLVLWSGDNENDGSILYCGSLPSMNRISREVLPRAIARHDPSREYLPSSPYYSVEEERKVRCKVPIELPEQHRWGWRDWYKCEYYENPKCAFISEMGFHGCVTPESLERFIDREYLNDRHSAQWKFHSVNRFYASERYFITYRIELMEKHVRRMFGEVPDDYREFSYLSQIVNAEAFKLFIERARTNKPQQRGLIWWNFLDGWAEFSEAPLDFYFNKKLSFDVIARSESPFTLVMTEDENGLYAVHAVNDTLESKKTDFTVKDADSGEILQQGVLFVRPNAVSSYPALSSISAAYGKPKMLLIEWRENGKTCFNHFITGDPVYRKEDCVRWYRMLEQKK